MIIDTGLRLKLSSASLSLLRERFNTGVTYKGRNLKWDTVITMKTTELGGFLKGKSAAVDFAEPSPKLLRRDDRELRVKILALTQSRANDLGIGKSTLHYLRKNAKRDEPFTIHRKISEKLSQLSTG